MDMSTLKRSNEASSNQEENGSEAIQAKRPRAEQVEEDVTVDEREITRSYVAGSRKSPLAVIQTESIVCAMKKVFPDFDFPIKTMQTLGDRILHLALPKIGEKGLFTRDLENALNEKRVDFLVHSLKDLPTTMPEGMALGCVYRRDNPFDCVIFNSKHAGKKLEDLPPNSVIGTSSLRRVAQLKRKYPGLVFHSVRGNLNTRLRKLQDEGLYDAIILAKAGIDRMGWGDKCGQILEKEIAYAIGQGAMAIEIRDDDKMMMQKLGEITDIKTLLTVVAERAFMRTLDGGCSTPVGCNVDFEDGTLTLRGVCMSVDGKEAVEDTLSAPITYTLSRPEGEKQKEYFVSNVGVVCDTLYRHEYEKAEKLGDDVAQLLITKGADEILKAVKLAIPNVTNIQIPISNSGTMKFV